MWLFRIRFGREPDIHPVRVRTAYETATLRTRNESKGARVLQARSTTPPTKRRSVYEMDFYVVVVHNGSP
jgi:hypothetical protein